MLKIMTVICLIIFIVTSSPIIGILGKTIAANGIAIAFPAQYYYGWQISNKGALALAVLGLIIILWRKFKR